MHSTCSWLLDSLLFTFTAGDALKFTLVSSESFSAGLIILNPSSSVFLFQLPSSIKSSVKKKGFIMIEHDQDPDSSSPSNSNSIKPPKSIAQNNPKLILTFGSISLVLILLRLGPLFSLLSLFIAFTLSTLPEFRSIVDSIIGLELKPQDRIQTSFSFLNQNRDLKNHSNPKLSQEIVIQSTNQLPQDLLDTFNSVFDLLIRDFVENWYLNPAVSTGHKAFLNHLRLALNQILQNAYNQVSTKSTKDTIIYLIGCLSMNLVRELNQKSNLTCHPSIHPSVLQRQQLTRNISQEILLTLASPSITSSPIITSLLSEILAVQLISLIESYDEDHFNQFIINSLGAVSAQVSQETVQEIKESVKQVNQQDPSTISNSPSINSSSHSSPLPNYFLNLNGNQIINTYLKTLPDLNFNSINFLHQNNSLQNIFNSTPLWSSNLTLTQSQLSNLLSQINPTVEIESLIKIWNHLDSFQKTVQVNPLKSDMIKRDAIVLLSALAPLITHVMNTIIQQENDPTQKTHLSNNWTSVVVETLRRLESDRIIELKIFGNLQDWIIHLLNHLDKNILSDQLNLKFDQLPSIIPKESNQYDHKISYMAIPFIPSNQSSPSKSPSSNLQSKDLGSIHTHHQPWEKLTSSQANSPDDRPRSFSFTRTATSPPSSDWEPSHRQSLPRSHLSNRSSTMSIHPSNLSHSFKIPFHPPQEGDMTEGYSLDQSSEDEDMNFDSFKQSDQENSRRTSNTFDNSFLSNPLFSSSPKQQHSHQATSSPQKEPQQQQTFTVSVTDMSSPTAFDPKTGLIKQKKDINLLIAVEAKLVPGFIVTRKWSELERMDNAINKMKIIGVGTLAFPRALLPTSLNFKTIEHVLRELEAYLECLLNNERYSKSEPVLKFFAKERSGMNDRSSSINNLFNSTSSTLDSIGKGVANVGKEVVGKPVDIATMGFNKFSKGVLSGLPFTVNSSTKEQTENRNSIDAKIDKDFVQSRRSSASVTRFFLDDGRKANESHESLTNVSSVKSIQEENTVQSFKDSITEPSKLDEPDTKTGTSLVGGSELRTIQDQPISSATERSPKSSISEDRIGLVGTRSRASSMILGSELLELSPESKAAIDLKTNSKPIFEPSEVKLTGQEFDAIVVGIVSVLEAAYGIESNPNGNLTTGWSMKRGILRVLETVLRTTSLSKLIKKSIEEIIEKFEKVETYVGFINQLKSTLWPDGHWKTVKQSSQQPGEGANHFNHENHDESTKKLIELELEAKKKRKEEARRLFLNSWSSLKLGLGSNATDLAANKVFDLFQRQEYQNSNTRNNANNLDVNDDKSNCSDDRIKNILNKLLLDFIRIVLLL
ncbi:hypothetical protein O181_041404 [Austropuccinia psidii MF-1]|uniref:PXA domain-containing protein n=1 Tax=Austropuccinia psidii MF-1 TaxID=1389203 RepID=A0A9Q3DEC4_9BASI|nr:hypothetical protein [Austropuccinia psidii MF-1]